MTAIDRLPTLRSLIKHDKVEVTVEGNLKMGVADYLICGEQRDFCIEIKAREHYLFSDELASRLTGKLDYFLVNPKSTSTSGTLSKTPSLHRMRSVESLLSSASNSSMDLLSTRLGQIQLKSLHGATLVDSQTLRIIIPVRIDSNLEFDEAVATLRFHIYEEIQDATMQSFLTRNTSSVHMLKKVLDEATFSTVATGGTPIMIKEVDLSLPLRRCLSAELRVAVAANGEPILHLRLAADDSSPPLLICDIKVIPGERHLSHRIIQTKHLSANLIPMTMYGGELAGFAFSLRALSAIKDLTMSQIANMPVFVDLQVTDQHERPVYLSFESMADFSILASPPINQTQIIFSLAPDTTVYRSVPFNLDISIYNGRDRDLDIEIEFPLEDLNRENEYVVEFISLIRKLCFGRLKPKSRSTKSIPIIPLEEGICKIKKVLLRDQLSGDQLELTNVLDITVLSPPSVPCE